MTGASMQDGLADTFDGLAEGDMRARAEIMKDSRLGNVRLGRALADAADQDRRVERTASDVGDHRVDRRPCTFSSWVRGDADICGQSRQQPLSCLVTERLRSLWSRGELCLRNSSLALRRCTGA